MMAFLLFHSERIYSQKATTADSLFQAYVKGKNDTLRIRSLLSLGEQLFGSNPDSSLACWKLAEQMAASSIAKVKPTGAAKNSYYRIHGSALTNIGFYYYNKGNSDKALEYYDKGKEKYEIAGYLEGEGVYYVNIGQIYQVRGMMEKAKQAMLASEKVFLKLNDNKMLTYSYNNLGNLCNSTGSNLEALEYFGKAQRLAATTQNAQLEAVIANNMAFIYDGQGDLKKATENYLIALNKFEAIKFYNGVATVLNNLGLIYSRQGDSEKGLEYLTKSLSLAIASQSHSAIGRAYNNIGKEYFAKGQYDSAEANYTKSGLAYAQANEKRGLATSANNLGNIYEKKNQPEKALQKYQEAVLLGKEIGDKPIEATGHINIGTHNIKYGKDIAAGIKEYQLGYEVAKAGDNIEYQRNAAEKLKEAYTLNKEPVKALEMYELYIKLRDSLNSESNKKAAMKSMFKYEYEKKEALAKVEFEKQKAISDAELQKNQFLLQQNQQNLVLLTRENEINSLQLKTRDIEIKQKETEAKANQHEIELLNQDKKLKEAEAKRKEEEIANQRMVLYATGGGGIMVLGFLMFAVRAYRRKKKDNFLIKQQKEIVEEQKQIVETQKHLVEEKQKEILDSINYAKRIQYTLLAHEELLQHNLNKCGFEHFVFFNPKDIVSGDFYWATTHNNKFYLAVCDSTGHGVPGAFMSLLNISFLSEAINEKSLEQPHEILNYVRQKLIDNISKEGQKDGFDGILICLDLANTQSSITYAAAHNAPLIIKNGEIISLEADKMPVGIGERKESFSTHTIDVASGDSLFLYTDGYADQFGGPKGKKFKYKPLNQLLSDNSRHAMEIQKEKLKTNFAEWRGDLEQVDDVCIIGLRKN